MKQIIMLLLLVFSLNCKGQQCCFSYFGTGIVITKMNNMDTSIKALPQMYVTTDTITTIDIWQLRYRALSDLWSLCTPQVNDRKKFKIALKRYRELMR